MPPSDHAKHVLIVSASTGGGHMRAAEALEKTLLERYPHLQVTNIDMMQCVSWLFKNSMPMPTLT